MTTEELLQLNSIAISLISLLVSMFSLVIAIVLLLLTRRRIILLEKRFQHEINIRNEDTENNQKMLRLEFLRDLFNRFTFHNWNLIKYSDFPGVYPELESLEKEIEKGKDNELFGLRVVTLEHFNILLRVFSHREVLHSEDIEGFSHWANDWFLNSEGAIRTILVSGDTYPLDFIEWLRDDIFARQGGEFTKLCGPELKNRLDTHKKKKSIK